MFLKSTQGLGIITKEGLARLKESQTVDGYSKTVFYACSREGTHMNSQSLCKVCACLTKIKPDKMVRET